LRTHFTFTAMKPTRLAATTALLWTCALSGCSHAGASSTPQLGGSSAHIGPTTATAGAADQDCTGGLTSTAAGVVRITCGGTATIRVHAGDVNKDFHGGECHSAGDVWSAAAGVVIDITGGHGSYTGPPVDSVAINNTATPGKGTIQVVLGGKNYYDLGEATITLTSAGKSAHIKGASHRLSDVPGAKITVDVTC
jgi:hypothetical protein